MTIIIREGGQQVQRTFDDRTAWEVLQRLRLPWMESQETMGDYEDIPPPDASMEEVKTWHIHRAHQYHDGVLARTARALGMDPTSLKRRGIESRHGNAGNAHGRHNLKSSDYETMT